ncbi:MAG: PKD domain-containing protein, partial [Bacteroidota bacterium]|nr:PKD domain-containing protein [Bacteroidota bacterium]
MDSTTCNIADTATFVVDLQQAATFNAQIDVPTIPPCSDPTLIPLNASFTGSGADSLSWDLGDGTVYNDSTNFTYYYSNPGIYTISMTAWDFTCNNTNTVTQVVNFLSTFSSAVANAPGDTTICSAPPFNINFSSDGSTPNVFWDFGDGNTSTQPNPINAYSDSGAYQVMFIAIDSTTCNIADTAFFNVEIIQAPTFNASFTLPTIPPCTDPDSVVVNASFTGTGLDSLVWNMDDGTIIIDSTSISHSYTNEGIYNISVSAWGFCGNDTTIYQTFNFNTD